MFGTEFIKGQGLGNQLFCYVTARCIALDRGYEFVTAGWENFANNIHSQKGMYFMDIEGGRKIGTNAGVTVYNEWDDRLRLPNSGHDIKNGCCVSKVDFRLWELPDNTLIYGILQDEKYFKSHLEEIKEWFHVKEEYESDRFSRENLCVINIRGGEYVSHKELFLNRNYWIMAMEHMRKIRPDMQFVIITDDIKVSSEMFPEIEVCHLDLAGDYTAIKNAYYLILSNSSFAYFPAVLSETVKYIIAPKYWARYNVSDGYWSSEQNIYSGFYYMDRKGKLSDSEECRKELELYKCSSRRYARLNQEARSLDRVLFSAEEFADRIKNAVYKRMGRGNGNGGN